MSLKLIQQYHHKIQEIVEYGGSKNETAIRPAFQKLLDTPTPTTPGMPIFSLNASCIMSTQDRSAWITP